MKRLRAGILLVLISWLPIAQLSLYIAHNNGKLASDQASDSFRATVWGIQIIVGLIGVGLAGRVALDEAKKEGWKRTPALLWKLFREGKDTDTPETHTKANT